MKRIILFLSITALLTACSKPQIEGSWKPLTLDGQELSKERQSFIFKFLEEGVFTMTNGEESGSGNWSFDSDAKEMVVIFSLTRANGEVNNETFNWTNVAFNEKEMTVNDRAGKIKLIRQ